MAVHEAKISQEKTKREKNHKNEKMIKDPETTKIHKTMHPEGK